MQRLGEHFSVRSTPQTEPIPGRTDMTPNSAGGYGWELDKWGKLDRWLLLGTEGGTFYTGERELVIQNASNTVECIKEDGVRVIERIAEVSSGGKAAKNDYALFALSLAMTFGDEATRQSAYQALPAVARTGTHLFIFLNYVESMRGWSRGLRSAVAEWYNFKEPKALAYQLTKYKQRYGFSHRDALRLSHPKPRTLDHDRLFAYATSGEFGGSGGLSDKATWEYIAAVEVVKEADAKRASDLIKMTNLPREVVPTELLNSPAVWESLLGERGERMPMTALIRNLGNLTKAEVLKPMSDLSLAVADRLGDPQAIRKARVHPMSVLTALMTYRSGGGYRGSGNWTPVAEIVDGLEAAFYYAFENVEPTNKRILYAIDVSGSMTYGEVAGVPGLTPSMAAGAMSLVCAATEPYFAFWGFDHDLHSLPITRCSTLSEAMSATSRNGGGTDASLPFVGTLQQGIEVDAFVLLTDSETWYGRSHPVQALNEYRRQTGIPAKLVVIGMTANESTIGDPQDASVLDVVGLSTDTPRIVSDFIR